MHGDDQGEHASQTGQSRSGSTTGGCPGGREGVPDRQRAQDTDESNYDQDFEGESLGQHSGSEHQKSASQLPQQEKYGKDRRRRQNHCQPAASRVELAKARPQERQKGCQEGRALVGA